MSDSEVSGWSTAEDAANKFASEIKGKTVLITGVSPGGIGAETARVIANFAALTIIAGRNLDKLKETEDQIKQATPEAHVLINNAGIMQLPTFTTLEGTNIEAQFGVNHVGPFLFTNLIKPRMAASKAPRVLNVAGGAHQYGPLRPEASFGLNGEEYNDKLAYGQSKTANMLFAVGLAERWKDIGATAFSLHPGIIDTNLGRHLTFRQKLGLLGTIAWVLYIKWSYGALRESPLLMKTIPQGACTTIVAAFDPSISEFTGSYLDDAVIHNERALSYAKDKAEADRLWSLSETLVGQKF